MNDVPEPSEINQGQPAKQPLRSRPLGIALLFIATLLVGGTAYLAYYSFNSDASALSHKSDLINGAMLIFAAVWALQTGRKLLTKDAKTVLEDDPRRPIVYLRPFDEDSRRTSMQPIGVRIGGKKILLASKPASWEQKIAGAFDQIGPFVSVGAPGDKLAPLGSARMYLANDEWREQVEMLVRNAAAIVLQPEASEGTRWEVKKVSKWVDPRRVLVLVPNPELRPLGYARIQALTASAFATPLPKDCQRADAFMFDEDGEPQPIVFGRKTTTALRPFVEQLQRLPDATMVPP